MATVQKQKDPPGQALERVRPQERALVQAAHELGILQESGGALMIDLSNPELARRYIVLAPAATLVQADPNFTPSVSVVWINPDPDAGDVYPIEKQYNGKPKTLALTKVGLRKLGDKAGIEHLPPRIEYHEKNLTVTAAIRFRRPDGTFATGYGSQHWISENEYEDVENQCPDTMGWDNKKHETTPKERADWIKKRWTQVRKSNLRMTEAKALSAAYRDNGLPGLKQKYDPEEFWCIEDGQRIPRPFLVTSTTFTPDTRDIRVLGMLMTGGQQATDLLYGPAAVSAHTDAIEGVAFDHDEAPANVDPETGEIFEGAAAEVEPQGHGERPTEDPIVPEGDHKGKHLSEAIRADRAWGEGIAKSNSGTWGPAAEAWLLYIYGPSEGGENVPF